jgi:hypothetical protein
MVDAEEQAGSKAHQGSLYKSRPRKCTQSLERSAKKKDDNNNNNPL